MKYNHEWFLNRIKEVRPNDFDEYEFLETYTKSREPIKAKHKVCGNIFYLNPNSFISRGSKCPKCARKKAAKTQKYSTEEIQRILPEYIILEEEYKGANEKVCVSCLRCGSTYKTLPRYFKHRGCTRCSGRYRREIKDVSEEIKRVTQGEYEVVSEKYKNSNTPLKVKHKKCGNVYNVTRHNFTNKGRRCPYCKSSIGEALTSYVLNNMGYEYTRQKGFSDLRGTNPLKYDFYIKGINTLIEYQGEQHYKPVEFFGGEESLSKQKELDKIKRDYAISKGMKLIEIPYTMDTEEKIYNYIKDNL